MAQIIIDEQGYLDQIRWREGPIPGAIPVEDSAVESIDLDIISCYRWVDGKAILDEEKAAALQEEWLHPLPAPEERLAALEALYLESILGGGL